MNKQTLSLLLISLMALVGFTAQAGDTLVWYNGQDPVRMAVQGETDPVVRVATEMFADDMLAVTGRRPQMVRASQAVVRLYQLDKARASVCSRLAAEGVPVEQLRGSIDGFHISIAGEAVRVVGANGRGAAYGLLELSRLAGVSPWVWWGDLVPERRHRLTLSRDYSTLQSASVEWRGIFLNDEDWSLRPWSYTTFEPGEQGVIGVQTYKKVFQLLLRLRANTIWPAMHPGTKAFFQIEGAKEMADSCGIAVGTSHCEPLLRNNVEEWDEQRRGRFNYLTNRAQVVDYWTERLREVKGSAGGNLFTIGMRGIHDGSMEGVSTMPEKFDALQQVIDDQQELIRRHIGDPAKQTQVFVPYKEVLEIYERGLKVPDYVTLMWCDDNYGYMTRLSNEREQLRSGGAGVYYHLSYWGRPHDYLWLTTTQPGLIYHQMKAAYDHQVRKIWIANVHDPKVAGYDLELFLDLAWDIQCVSPQTLVEHYQRWLTRQFGEQVARHISPAMQEFYRLCGERKPEFMGWSQVELSKQLYDRGLSPVRHTAFSLTAFGGELERYLGEYQQIVRQVEEARQWVRPDCQDAYLAAILYPVRAAACQAIKHLEAQRARLLANGSGLTDPARDTLISEAVACSQAAYRQVQQLTDTYNYQMSQGKWRGSMNMRPRDLPVFGAPVLPCLLSDEEVERYSRRRKPYAVTPVDLSDGTIARHAADWSQASAGAQPIQMLGHSMKAVSLPREGVLTYEFETEKEGEAVVRVALIPTQPNDGGDLRFSVSIDGGEPQLFSLKEPFRSEGWKQHVLRGQAVKVTAPQQLTAGRHTLTIRALDHSIVVDQWMVDFHPSRPFYLFPVP